MTGMTFKNQIMNKCDGSSKIRTASAFVLSSPQINNGVQVAASHAGVYKSLKFIRKNFSAPIQLKDLVKISGMSRRGFQKAFKKNVGTNPGLFLRSLRIEQAKRLLVEHDMKLSQIAARCGFRSENTFCIAFLRDMKTSPKRFQRQCWLTTCRERHQINSASLPASRLFQPDNTGNLPNRLNHSETISLHEFQIS